MQNSLVTMNLQAQAITANMRDAQTRTEWCRDTSAQSAAEPASHHRPTNFWSGFASSSLYWRPDGILTIHL